MTEFRIAPESPDHPQAKKLITRHLSQMAAQSPAESCHAFDDTGLAADGVSFYLLWNGDAAISMGALSKIDDTSFELKSMHTLTEARGSGAGRAMLEYLLRLAREKGATAIYLETGSTDDFLPARKLYEKYGFVTCGPFGEYEFDPWSVYMMLDLQTGS